MSFGVKHEKFYNSDVENKSSPDGGGSGHKNSLRGTKFVRRARSIKDDLFVKISQMRTPTSSLGRSQSPNSSRGKAVKSLDDGKPTRDLNYHVRQVKNALTHFKDVISKKKLEMLPGNGTIVLESIANVHSALQSYQLNEHSSALISATTQVNLSLGALIKLCDKVLLTENEEHCAYLSNENVQEVIELVDDAVQNLVKLANEKLSGRDNNLMYSVGSGSTNNTLLRPVIDIAGQRTSLPDIPLTPRERDILEQSSSNQIRTSHSTESILRSSSPPPKPPLPHRSSNPPPLPPKRKSQHKMSQNDSDYGIDSSLLNCGSDRMSLRSRSPDDNSSLLSASSLDSALNHSREEEELRGLTMDQYFDEPCSNVEIERFFAQKNTLQKSEDVTDSTVVQSLSTTNEADLKNQRISNESGFASMHSLRASMPSVLIKRSTEQNVQSSQSITTSIMNTEQSSILKSTNDTTMEILAESQRAHTEKRQDTSIVMTGDNLLKFSQKHLSKATASSSITCSSSNSNSSSTVNDSETTPREISSSVMESLSSASTASSSIATTKSIEMSSTAVATTSILTSSNVLNDDNVFLNNNNNTEKTRSSTLAAAEDDAASPPALPVKTRTRSTRRERHISQYDNVEETDNFSNTIQLKKTSEMKHVGGPHAFISKHQSLIEPRRFNHFDDSEEPPPLPVKKKHMFQSVAYSVMAYMEMFGNCSQTTHNTQEFLRHSVHTYNVTHSSSEHISHNQNITHSQTMSLSPLRKQMTSDFTTPFTTPIAEENPPALPPKRQRVNSKTPSIINTPPSSPKLIVTQPPKPQHQNENNQSSHSCKDNNEEPMVLREVPAGGRSNEDMKNVKSDPLVNNCSNRNFNNCNKERKSDNVVGGSSRNDHNICNNTQLFNEVKKLQQKQQHQEHLENKTCSSSSTNTNNDNNDDDEVVFRHHSPNNQVQYPAQTPSQLRKNIIEEFDVTQFLVFKKDGEDGPDIKGGYPDALIVHATKVQKVTENAFGEAFITTFRTFISPLQLIEKLTHRYSIFHLQINENKQKAAKESFSLLVRVVNDLTAPDLTSLHILSILIEFVQQLICSGQLMMAKLLRMKILEKIMIFKHQKSNPVNPILTTRAVITNPPTLIDLKSTDIAEQMTLLDAELFQKIEIPEVLVWAQEQNEERSPNLTRFTEHFNKMSYWARSQILKQEDAKDREKHVIKFIKIMKHLRKINNYNSYLALLSALDSAPIRRLEWHKTITEGLKEYCALIDSSSSFRAYRQALAETNPPCIPYIGLVLQDLTFVHIGNQDCLSEGIINFSKRWQQHNIVVNMIRFKKCSSYPFKKSERIIGFFDNFENYLDEDAMWQISENIKPRISRKPIPN